jgi:hypothetical protein
MPGGSAIMGVLLLILLVISSAITIEKREMGHLLLHLSWILSSRALLLPVILVMRE